MVELMLVIPYKKLPFHADLWVLHRFRGITTFANNVYLAIDNQDSGYVRSARGGVVAGIVILIVLPFRGKGSNIEKNTVVFWA